MPSRMTPSTQRRAWRPVEPAQYVSAYRGETHRMRAPRVRGWRRVGLLALMAVLAVAAFWGVRLAIWGVMRWMHARGMR
jgi:hypothetical protein